MNNIAVALEASGRFAEALLVYETALSVAPNDRVLRRNYSQFKEFYETRVAPPPPPEDAAGKGTDAESEGDQGDADEEADDA
jgi:hypothetical protein